MLKQNTLYEAILSAIIKGSTYISDDVYDALKTARDKEENETSKLGLEASVKSLELSRERCLPACPDTGWPLFFFKIGNEAVIEGGIIALEETARKAVISATEQGYLRRTMKHPLSGYDPGTNVGTNIPWFTYKYVPGTQLQVTYVAKGGGSDLFCGTQSRMVALADGSASIKKFIIDVLLLLLMQGRSARHRFLGWKLVVRPTLQRISLKRRLVSA